jgi:glyoxylase-like metal-dependent hydrolase (beta-lactamase superfamily II)
MRRAERVPGRGARGRAGVRPGRGDGVGQRRRRPRAAALGDGETLELGRHALRWFDTPHLPHAWECGFLFDATTRTLLCGDLFTQGGHGETPLVETDILGPSEAFRVAMDYYAHSPDTRGMLERLAGASPTTLACMHGSAWRGDGGALLRALAVSVEERRSRAA